MQYISPQQDRILLALAKYKYLTIGQLHRLEIGKDKEFIRKNLATLRERKLTDRIAFALIPNKGKFEDIHFLTERGAKEIMTYLELEPDQVKYPSRSSTFFKNDYLHRVNTIDFMIAYYQWAELNNIETDFFDTYFDKVGSQRASTNGIQSKTRLDLPNGQNISPDGIVRYNTPNGSFLFCIEMYNGKDTKRVIEQLRKLVYATFQGIPSMKYSHSKANRILVVFEHEVYKLTAIERILHDEYLSQFEGLERFLLFSTIEESKNNFDRSWMALNGQFVNVITL